MSARSLSQDLRAKWCEWLPQLFRQEGQPLPARFRGEVIRVLLGCNEETSETELSESPFSIIGRSLTEGRIQDLIEGQSEEGRRHPRRAVLAALGVERRLLPLLARRVAVATHDRAARHATADPRAEHFLQPSSAWGDLTRRKPSCCSGTAPTASTCRSRSIAPVDLPSPPPVNALGMIGQAEAVAQLVAQVNYFSAANKRFPDKLLVGPAGVGKSSLARAIARQLLNEEEILFNGADLRTSSMLVSRLQENRKIPVNPRGDVCVQKSLLFIDEVHAISSAVATALLSAMDDSRVTTIDGVNYDFKKVIIILATTDSGRLSEAFNSRPDKTYLRAYTLHELAGIVWLHGKENLGGRELAREACYEIAARMRCQTPPGCEGVNPDAHSALP